ncbi:MAG: CPBP family intramembrane metalloprotease [Candidatus Zixiibacteriota bacterium]|nr:MAG: CPBP family intramembrane metalloprotease [candidate division Zixibacteria bacterium]
MSLKYNCPLCGFEIITDFLAVGDLYRCPSCGSKIFVPDNATETEETPNLPRESTAPPGDAEIEVEDQMLAAEDDLTEKEVIKKVRPKEWGVWSVIKFVFAYFLTLIFFLILSFLIVKIFVISFYPPKVIGKWVQDEIWFDTGGKLIGFFDYFIPLILIYYSVVKRHKNDFFKAMNIDRLSKKDTMKWIKISLLFTMALAGFALLFEIPSLSKYIPSEVPLEEHFKEGYLEVLIFSLFALLAPVQEEIVFRGYIYKGLANSLGAIWSGIIVTTIFVGLHASQLAYSPILLSFILAGAVFTIIVRIKTGSLTKCIIIHQVHNTISIVLIWLWILFFGLSSNAGM